MKDEGRQLPKSHLSTREKPWLHQAHHVISCSSSFHHTNNHLSSQRVTHGTTPPKSIHLTIHQVFIEDSETSHSAHRRGDSKQEEIYSQVMNLVESHMDRGHLSRFASMCLVGRGDVWPEIFEGGVKRGQQGGEERLGRRNSVYKAHKYINSLGGSPYGETWIG